MKEIRQVQANLKTHLEEILKLISFRYCNYTEFLDNIEAVVWKCCLNPLSSSQGVKKPKLTTGRGKRERTFSKIEAGVSYQCRTERSKKK